MNGVTASLGDRADPARDELCVDGERLRFEKLEYWLVNKPVGVLTTVHDPEGRRTILDLAPGRQGRLFPVGRLDRDTSGLVLLTNDGALTQAILHPSHEIEREYEVVVKGELAAREQERLARGIRLEDGWTAPAHVTRVRYDLVSDRSTFHLVLREGRKRQIRRSLRALGRPVRGLRRVRMGPLRLGELPAGKARRLVAAELEALAKLVRRVEADQAGKSGAQVPGNRTRKKRPRKRNLQGSSGGRG